jgi:hypothetical protein
LRVTAPATAPEIGVALFNQDRQWLILGDDQLTHCWFSFLVWAAKFSYRVGPPAYGIVAQVPLRASGHLPVTVAK